jgi:hypothetical protein
VNPAESRLHAKVEFGSLLVNVNVADALLLGSVGFDTIVAAGPVVSTVNVLVGLTPMFPPASDCVARAV